MRRGTSIALGALLIVSLILSVVTQVWLFPAAVQSVVTVFPEVSLLTVPAVTWGVLAVLCWQAVAVIALRVIVLSRTGRFYASAHEWLRAMVGFILAFLVLVVSALIALTVMGYTTPGVMIGLIVGGLVASVTAVSLILYLATGR